MGSKSSKSKASEFAQCNFSDDPKKKCDKFVSGIHTVQSNIPENIPETHIIKLITRSQGKQIIYCYDILEIYDYFERDFNRVFRHPITNEECVLSENSQKLIKKRAREIQQQYAQIERSCNAILQQIRENDKPSYDEIKQIEQTAKKMENAFRMCFEENKELILRFIIKNDAVKLLKQLIKNDANLVNILSFIVKNISKSSIDDILEPLKERWPQFTEDPEHNPFFEHRLYETMDNLIIQNNNQPLFRWLVDNIIIPGRQKLSQLQKYNPNINFDAYFFMQDVLQTIIETWPNSEDYLDILEDALTDKEKQYLLETLKKELHSPSASKKLRKTDPQQDLLLMENILQNAKQRREMEAQKAQRQQEQIKKEQQYQEQARKEIERQRQEKQRQEKQKKEREDAEKRRQQQEEQQKRQEREQQEQEREQQKQQRELEGKRKTLMQQKENLEQTQKELQKQRETIAQQEKELQRQKETLEQQKKETEKQQTTRQQIQEGVPEEKQRKEEEKEEEEKKQKDIQEREQYKKSLEMKKKSALTAREQRIQVAEEIRQAKEEQQKEKAQKRKQEKEKEKERQKNLHKLRVEAIKKEYAHDIIPPSNEAYAFNNFEIFCDQINILTDPENTFHTGFNKDSLVIRFPVQQYIRASGQEWIVYLTRIYKGKVFSSQQVQKFINDFYFSTPTKEEYEEMFKQSTLPPQRLDFFIAKVLKSTTQAYNREKTSDLYQRFKNIFQNFIHDEKDWTELRKIFYDAKPISDPDTLGEILKTHKEKVFQYLEDIKLKMAFIGGTNMYLDEVVEQRYINKNWDGQRTAMSFGFIEKPFDAMYERYATFYSLC